MATTQRFYRAVERASGSSGVDRRKAIGTALNLLVHSRHSGRQTPSFSEAVNRLMNQPDSQLEAAILREAAGFCPSRTTTRKELR